MAKTLNGVVSSDRGDKTIVVTVATRMTHPIYKKQYTVSHKFMAHDERNEAKVGDSVIIEETRPISARKRFALLSITSKAAIRHIEEDALENIQAPAKTPEVKAKSADDTPKSNSAKRKS